MLYYRQTVLPALLTMRNNSVEFSDWTGNPLLTCEKVALDLKRMLRVSNNLLCQIQSARKILLSGNQPLNPFLENLLNFVIREFTKPGRQRQPERHLEFRKASLVSIRYL